MSSGAACVMSRPSSSDPAGARADEAGDRPQERRLARAVGAEHRGDARLRDVDRDVVERDHRAVGRPQRLNAQHRPRPQVGVEHAWVDLDVGRLARGQAAAEVEHDDAVADRHHQVHVVLDQQHRRLGRERPDAGAELGHVVLVEAARRLVEQQQAGPRDQRARQRHPLLDAERQAAREPVGASATPRSSSAASASARSRRSARSERGGRGARLATPARAWRPPRPSRSRPRSARGTGRRPAACARCRAGRARAGGPGPARSRRTARCRRRRGRSRR